MTKQDNTDGTAELYDKLEAIIHEARQAPHEVSCQKYAKQALNLCQQAAERARIEENNYVVDIMARYFKGLLTEQQVKDIADKRLNELKANLEANE